MSPHFPNSGNPGVIAPKYLRVRHATQSPGAGTLRSVIIAEANPQLQRIILLTTDALNDPSDSAPYNFLVGTTYSDQLVIMLQYMMEQWAAEGNDMADMRVAFFHHDSPFGTSPLADGEAVAEMSVCRRCV